MAKPKSESKAVTASPVDAIIEQATGVTAQALLLSVTDVKTQQAATDLLVLLKSVEKKAEAEEKRLVEPLQTQTKAIQALFKPGFKRLEGAEAHLRQQLTSFIDAERERAEAERIESMKKADAAAKKGDNKKALALATEAVNNSGPGRVMAASASVVRESTLTRSQVTTRSTWTFEVKVPLEVPREYLCVDEKAVRAAVKAGIRDIAGIRIYEETGLVVGGA